MPSGRFASSARATWASNWPTRWICASRPWALKFEFVSRYAPGQTGLQLPADAPVSAALSLAANWLAEHESVFDFLPPKVTRWQQMTARYGSSKLRTAGAVAALLLLLVVLAFGFQQVQLLLLGAEWNGMAAKVKNIETVQTQIGRFRPWSDTTMPSLTVLKVLSQSFPAQGTVYAKTVEIRDQSTVTCAGLTQDIPTLLEVIDRLRKNNGVSNVRQPNIRGASPRCNSRSNSTGMNSRPMPNEY